MRNTMAVVCATGAMLFGGAGLAGATSQGVPAPSSTSTTLADNSTGDTNHNQNDNGKWGMFGLLGLFGLAGLKRRNTTDTGVAAASTAGLGHA